MHCAGSVALCDDLPDLEDGGSEAATRGTAAHAVGADILTGKNYEPGDVVIFDDGGVKVRMDVDEEMLAGVNIYVNHVLTTMEYMRDPQLFLEQEVVLPGTKGTSDCILRDATTMHVMDYKNGRMPVLIQDEYDDSYNSQLLIYAAGALKKYDPHGEIQTVVLTIVQPNCPEVRQIQSRTLPAHEIRQWAATELKQAVAATKEKDAPLVPGDWCQWCPVASHCPALLAQVQDIAAVDFAAVATPSLPEANLISPEQVANVLHWMPVLDSWMKQVAARAQEDMERGVIYPGFKLVRKKTHRAWPSGDLYTRLIEAGAPKGLTPADLLDVPDQLSPAKLEKKFKWAKTVVAAVAQKPEGGLTVVPNSDSRDAVQPGQDFQDFTGGEDLI
jgi:hypothetical protein